MAKKIAVKHAHHLTREEACAKLKELTTLIAERYKVQIQMAGDNRANVEGRGVNGFAQVDDTQAEIDLSVGLPASLVAGKIESTIQEYMAKYFA